MQTRLHPTFQSNFKKLFIRAWIASVVCFGVGLYLHKHDQPALGWAFSILFGLIVFGVLEHSMYALRHVKCLACDGKTIIIKNADKSQWLAVCDHCQITWDLQTGTGGE